MGVKRRGQDLERLRKESQMINFICSSMGRDEERKVSRFWFEKEWGRH